MRTWTSHNKNLLVLNGLWTTWLFEKCDWVKAQPASFFWKCFYASLLQFRYIYKRLCRKDHLVNDDTTNKSVFSNCWPSNSFFFAFKLFLGRSGDDREQNRTDNMSFSRLFVLGFLFSSRRRAKSRFVSEHKTRDICFFIVIITTILCDREDADIKQHNHQVTSNLTIYPHRSITLIVLILNRYTKFKVKKKNLQSSKKSDMIMSPAQKGTVTMHSIARKRKVVFHEIDFIQLSYTIGDNPCCGSGAPVACGGDVQERVSFEVDFFEHHRPRRRYKQELILSKSRRRSL